MRASADSFLVHHRLPMCRVLCGSRYLLLNNISGYMVYWFSFHHRVDKATRSLVNAEDTETDGTRITKGKKEKKVVPKPKTKGKLPVTEKEQPVAGKGKKGKSTTKETKKQAGSVSPATPLRSAKPKKTKAKKKKTAKKSSGNSKAKEIGGCGKNSDHDDVEPAPEVS